MNESTSFHKLSTALELSINQKSLQPLLRLLTNEVVNLNDCDKNMGNTILFDVVKVSNATISLQSKIFDLLIQYGADPTIKNNRNCSLFEAAILLESPPQILLKIIKSSHPSRRTYITRSTVGQCEYANLNEIGLLDDFLQSVSYYKIQKSTIWNRVLQAIFAKDQKYAAKYLSDLSLNNDLHMGITIDSYQKARLQWIQSQWSIFETKSLQKIVKNNQRHRCKQRL